MKNMSVIFLAIALLLISCDKTTNDTSSSSWTIGMHSYTGSTVQTSNYKQVIASAGQDSVQVSFAILPTTSSAYTVVSQSKADNNTLGATEMAVRYSVGAADVYRSTGAPLGTTVNVVLTGTSIAFVIPSISVEHRSSGTIIDTTTASAVIKQ